MDKKSPSLSRMKYQAPLIGRELELDDLRQRLERACAGESGVIFIDGEAGSGKTRLLNELIAAAHARGMGVIAGRAYDPEGLPPYLPFVEGLRQYLSVCEAPALRTRLAHDAEVLNILFRDDPPVGIAPLDQPAPGPRPQPSWDRYRLFEDLSGLFLRIARLDGALLLSLDDLHRADKPSLLLLRHLVRHVAAGAASALAGVPLLIAGTYRTVDVAQTDPLAGILADLQRDRLSERLTLAPLSPTASAALVESLRGAPAAPQVLERIYAETNGNPFYIEEMVRHLRAEGRDLSDPLEAATGWTVPDGVRQVLGMRLARLGPPAIRLLQAAAILGDGFRFDVLADVAGGNPSELLDALDEVLAAGVLREQGDCYYFSHALIRETIDTQLSAARRQRLHRIAAESIEATAADREAQVAALARHYRLAGPDMAGRALEYLLKAAASAAAVYAWEDAATAWRSAVDLAPPGDTVKRVELLLALGDALWNAGESAPAREAVLQAAAAARALGGGELLARAALSLRIVATTSGRVDRPLIALLEEALGGLAAGDSVQRAQLLARLSIELFWSGSPQRTRELSDAALAMASRTGDAAALAEALRAKHYALYGPMHVEERLALASRMVDLAEATGDRALAASAYGRRIIDLLERGDREAHDADLAAYARLAGELRQPSLHWIVLWHRVTQAMLEGRFEEGERLAFEAFHLGTRIGREDALQTLVAQTFRLRDEQGRIGEVEGNLRAAVKLFPHVPAWRCALAYVSTCQGRLDEARGELDSLAANNFIALEREPAGWIVSATFLALVCAALDDGLHAGVLYRLLLPHAQRNVLVGAGLDCYGSVSRYLGLLAATQRRWEAAERHFADALAMNERLGARPWLAWTQYDYAAMLLRRDKGRGAEAERATAMLNRAGSTATELGMTKLRGAVESLASQLSSPSWRRCADIGQVERQGDEPAPRLLLRRTPSDGQPAHVRQDPPTQSLPSKAGWQMAWGAVDQTRAAEAMHGPVPRSPLAALTARETEVLALLARGFSSRRIASELVLSVPTVNRHIANLYAKLGVRSRAEATACALGFRRSGSP